MATIVYGWGNVLKNKKLMGYEWCGDCCSFKPRYLSKLVFRVHISYIPIFMKTKGYYMACKGCSAGVEITKAQFKQLKEDFKPMSNSMAKKCFKEIVAICEPINELSDANVQYVIQNISQTYPIMANETIGSFYRKLITDVIGEKIERQRVLTQQQNAFLQQQAAMQVASAPSVQ
ncbi:MAG: hypothetical protein IJC65_00805 [Oscillospiraceae bacterium]|nr:hypothetical protein [Oscillospiraceae bacterium]